jgi:hypothetical protein
VGIFGTAIFFGDGVITPAVSVLGAVEGLEVAAPGLHRFIVPVSLLVLTGAVRGAALRHRCGIGRFFGPVTLVWFLVLAVLGVPHIARNPQVLVALLPHACAGLHAAHPGIAFVALGAVVLCVTGAEALYADLGHFGKRPSAGLVRLVMPALVLNYFGQGAMLLQHPENIKQPVLRDGAAVGAVPAHRAGHRGHGDRVAGADHGGVLGHQAGHPAGLPAAHAHHAHLGARHRPDLRALRQLGAVRVHRGLAVVRFGSSARWPRPTASR